MKTLKVLKYEKLQIPKYFRFKKFFGGDIILVVYRYKRIELLTPLMKYFLGLCLSFKKHGYTSFLRLRNYLGGEGLELSFNIYSPSILALKKIKMVKGNYNRSRLFYLRDRIAWESTIIFERVL